MAGQLWDASGYDASFSFVTAYGDALLDLLAVRPGERVLDVGCGTGHQAAALAAAGAEVVGLDEDEAMLAAARHAHPEVRFVRADAQDPDALVAATGGPVDAVLSNAALHWMPRQDDVVAGLARVLRPGGRLALEMGGTGNVARTIEAVRAGRAAVGLDPDVPTSWVFPSPAQMASRLERHGFTVLTLALLERPTPLADGTATSDWGAMFGAALVADVPTARRAEFDAAVDDAAAVLGLTTPAPWADYVRLRVSAVLSYPR